MKLRSLIWSGWTEIGFKAPNVYMPTATHCVCSAVGNENSHHKIAKLWPWSARSCTMLLYFMSAGDS